MVRSNSLEKFLKRQSKPKSFLTREGYRYIKPLGEGSFAKVGLFQKGKDLFAIRIIDIDDIVARKLQKDPSKSRSQIKHDLSKTMKKESAIVHVIEKLGLHACRDALDKVLEYEVLKDPRDPSMIYFISERMDEDLGSFIQNLPQKVPDLNDRQQIITSVVCQLVDGLDCLHKIGLVHGDIKEANILINGEIGEIKLSDFGGGALYKHIYRDDDWMRLTSITKLFQPPELLGNWKWKGAPKSDLERKMVISNALKSPKTDSWALGVMILQMLNPSIRNKFILGTATQEQIDNLIKRVIMPIKNPQYQAFFQGILTGLLHQNPTKRIFVGDIRKNPFFMRICSEFDDFVQSTNG